MFKYFFFLSSACLIPTSDPGLVIVMVLSPNIYVSLKPNKLDLIIVVIYLIWSGVLQLSVFVVSSIASQDLVRYIDV